MREGERENCAIFTVEIIEMSVENIVVDTMFKVQKRNSMETPLSGIVI